jgi:hypothetical protein
MRIQGNRNKYKNNYMIKEKHNLFYSAVKLPTLMSVVLSSNYVDNYNVSLIT